MEPKRACGRFWSVCIVCATSAGVPLRLRANPLNAYHRDTKPRMRLEELNIERAVSLRTSRLRSLGVRSARRALPQAARDVAGYRGLTQQLVLLWITARGGSEAAAGS